MAVRASTYAKELEAQLAGGKTVEQAHDVAASKANAETKEPRYKAWKDMSLAEKTATRLKELFRGKKTYKNRKFTRGGK